MYIFGRCSAVPKSRSAPSSLALERSSWGQLYAFQPPRQNHWLAPHASIAAAIHGSPPSSRIDSADSNRKSLTYTHSTADADVRTCQASPQVGSRNATN